MLRLIYGCKVLPLFCVCRNPSHHYCSFRTAFQRLFSAAKTAFSSSVIIQSRRQSIYRRRPIVHIKKIIKIQFHDGIGIYVAIAENFNITVIADINGFNRIGIRAFWQSCRGHAFGSIILPGCGMTRFFAKRAKEPRESKPSVSDAFILFFVVA